MSLNTFKKKSVIQYGSKRSGKPEGGIWLMSGPFGRNTSAETLAIHNYGPEGFSINGGRRNVGYIGKTYQNGVINTPYRGLYPCYNSSNKRQKSVNAHHVNQINVLGGQYNYIKPSVLSQKGMLEKKYKWINNGQYPNYWVQPNYTGNLTDSASQGMYIHNISVANDCINDVNNPIKYEGHIVKCSPTLCSTSTSRFKYNDMASKGPYTKNLYQPLISSQQTLKIQRSCANPKGNIKPFPFATVGVSKGNVGVVRGVGSGNPSICNNNENKIYLYPPSWYINSNIDNVES